MRVIAGKWRGRVLQSPRGNEIRPTTDRVKEALFSMIGRQIGGAIFVDLCCGAGGLAIEALSRGCRMAYLVDNSTASLSVARKNLQLCGAEKASYQLIKADSLKWLQNWPAPVAPFLVACDPPYDSDLFKGILSRLLEFATEGSFLLGVLEHGSTDSAKLEEMLSGVSAALLDDSAVQIRRYGQSSLALIKPITVDSAEG